MGTWPSATPWGTAIRTAREAASLSIPEAARRAGISPGQWGNIERGYQSERQGKSIRAPGTDATVAQMAAVVGLDASELAEKGRPKAATILERIQSAGRRPPRYDDPSERRIDADPDLSETHKHALISLLRALRGSGSNGATVRS